MENMMATNENYLTNPNFLFTVDWSDHYQKHSEIVVKDIVGKLISLSIADSYKNEIEERIPDQCFDFIKKHLNDLVHTNNLAFERDDKEFDFSNLPPIRKNSNQSETHTFGSQISQELFNINMPVFYDNKYSGSNLWINIIEPRKNKIDRAACSQVKVTKMPTNTSNANLNNNQSDMKILEQNNEGEISMISVPSLIMNSKKKLSTFVLMKKLSIINPNSNHALNTNLSIDMNNLTSSQIINPQTETVSKNNKKVVLLKQIDISDEETIKEDPMISNLREEKVKEIQKKEEESRMKKISDREKEVVKSDIFRNKKEIDGKKITFDIEGNVLNIKPIANEKLASDFKVPKCEVKNIDLKAVIAFLNNEKNPGFIANIGNNNLTPNHNTNNNLNVVINSKDKILSNSNLSKTDEKDSPTRTDNFNKNNPIGAAKGGVSISNRDINNPNKPYTNERYISNYSHNQNQEKISIQPAGSNFDLILPEIGVTIIEGAKKKGGEKDFFKKFQKYSKYDYNSLLKENASMMNSFSPLIKRGVSNKNLLKSDDLSYNPILYKDGINIINSLTGINKNSLANSTKIPKLNNTLLDSLKLSNKLTMSLKSTLDKLDFYPDYNEKLYEEEEIHNYGGEILNNRKNFINRKNVLNNVSSYIPQNDKMNIENPLDKINNFNLAIINDSNWGNSSGLSGSFKKRNDLIDSPNKKHKPSNRALQREIGSFIVATKLPRSRVFNHKINK